MTETLESDQDTPARQRPGFLFRTGLLLLLTSLLCVYPGLMVYFHHVANTIPANVPTQVWADPRVGTAVEMLEHEAFFGWASGKPQWHPQARLTAMPSYQSGITTTLAAFVAERANASSEPDSDLAQAQNLLNDVSGPEAENRAYAAIEALRRYDGRTARSLREQAPLIEDLRLDASLCRGQIGTQVENLRAAASHKSRGVFNREDVRLYYRAKGVLFACGMLIRAYHSSDLEIPGYRAAQQAVDVAFDRAVRPSPLTVSNPQPGDFSLGGNDLIYLTFLAREVDSELGRLEAVLKPAESN